MDDSRLSPLHWSWGRLWPGESLPPSLPPVRIKMAPLHTKFYSSTVISWDFNGEVPVLALEELTLFTSKQDAFITQECVKMFILNHDTNQKPRAEDKTMSWLDGEGGSRHLTNIPVCSVAHLHNHFQTTFRIKKHLNIFFLKKCYILLDLGAFYLSVCPVWCTGTTRDRHPRCVSSACPISCQCRVSWSVTL